MWLGWQGNGRGVHHVQGERFLLSRRRTTWGVLSQVVSWKSTNTPLSSGAEDMSRRVSQGEGLGGPRPELRLPGTT